MVLCHGSPCRLRQAGFHSPVRSSPVLCTQPIDFVQHHFPGSVWWEASGQGSAVRGRWEEEMGSDRGCLDTASWQSPQTPLEQLAAPPRHTLHPHLPARQPPSPPPVFPSNTDRCEPRPSPPPGQSDGTCQHTRSQNPTCLDPRLSLISACFKIRPSAKSEEN